MKKVIILYHSVYGNTKKVALAISRGFEAIEFQVDCRSILDFDLSELNNYDVIGIGGPTHFRRDSKPMRSFLSTMRQYKISNKSCFAFETKKNASFAGSAGNRILKVLKKMKLQIISPLIAAIVTGREGPLEESTLTKMEALGISIAEKLNRQNNHFLDEGGSIK